MENQIDLKKIKIQKKVDGTFIVDNNGIPFQITDDYPLGEVTADSIREYITKGGEYTDYNEPAFELSEKEKVLQQICELKAQLTATDYKVIKAVEIGNAVGNDIIAERQILRDKINILEKKL